MALPPDSEVNVNPEAGFSIVTYVGPGNALNLLAMG